MVRRGKTVRSGRVESIEFEGQSGLCVKWVTGQNKSFLNESIGLQVGLGRVDLYFSNKFFFFFNCKKTNIKLKRLRKKSSSH